jgi:uncharacterized protein (TIGR03437 family)
MFERALPDGAFAPASCSVGETAKPGEIVRAYAVGLGVTDPLVPTGKVASAAPLSRTLEKPRILLGHQSLEVLESVLTPGESGLYRVTFKLPPEIPEGPYPVTLAIGDNYAHPAFLGVGKAINFTTLPATPVLGVTGPSSPESIVRAQACGFLFGNAGGGFTGDGVTVTVRDSAGVVRPSLLLSASPNSLDFVVPAGTANGDARITIMTAEGTTSTAKLEIQTIAPRILLSVAQPDLPEGVIIRLRGGVQTVEPLSWTNLLIDLGREGDQVFLILFGTGWRGRSSLANTGLFFTSGRANPSGLPTDVNTLHVQAEFAGPQSDFAGLDQMNVRLPRSLAGRFILEGGFEVDGKSAVVPFLKWITFK